jgi:beta-lactamase class A
MHVVGRRAGLLAFFLLLTWLVPCTLSGQDIAPLKADIEKIISGYHGDVGVAVQHIESGRGFSINGNKRFPLASVYKLGIMAEVFHQVAEGKFSMHDRITLRPEMYNPWGQVMSHFEPGLSPTVGDLVYWMMVESDNMATDILLQKVGAENVNAYLRQLGLKEFSVDRSTKVIILDYLGFSSEKYYNLTGDALKLLEKQSEEIDRQRAEIARAHGPLSEAVLKFDQDPRDTGSPIDINQLLIKTFQGEVVSKEASQEMINIMLECRTGDARLKGQLPPGTPVAQKTGGLPTSNNSGGIIYLPAGKGHLAITVLDTNMNEEFSGSSNMIARTARAAYDFFIANP